MTRRIVSTTFLLAFALAIAAGCNKDGTDKPKETPAPAAAPAASPAPAAAPAAKARTGVPECDSYLATFEKYAACDKLPPGRRENQQKALELARRGMAGLDSPNLPAETKAAAAKGCKDGEDAIKANAVPGCL